MTLGNHITRSMVPATQKFYKFQNSPDILARDKKYITCLKLVETIVNRELGVALLNSKYYENLGKVSSFIDRSLDSLKLSQKAIFLEEFDDFFNLLIDNHNQEDFNLQVYTYLEANRLKLNYSRQELHALYSFIQFQKEHNLLSQLKVFGKRVISISICQELSVSSTEITALLKQEGELVIGLLESNLAQMTTNADNLKKTIALLKSFEQILNLGDDLLDVSTDIKNGCISIQNPIHHRSILLMRLTSRIIKTFMKAPLKCLYYYPMCSYFYLKHAR